MRGPGVAAKVRRTGRLMRMARTVDRRPRAVLRLGLIMVVWFVLGLMLLLRGALRRLIVG